MKKFKIFRKKKDKDVKGQAHPAYSESSGSHSSDASDASHSLYSDQSYDSSLDSVTDTGSACSITTTEARVDGVKASASVSLSPSHEREGVFDHFLFTFCDY